MDIWTSQTVEKDRIGMTVNVGGIFITFPPAVSGQTHWSLDSERNRFIEGESFIARDYFPVRYEIPKELKA